MCDVFLTCVSVCVSQQLWDESECRASALRAELAVLRESLQQGATDRQLMEAENRQLSDALNRVRHSLRFLHAI